MRAVAVALTTFATVALLTACGGGGSQPAGSIAVKMTEFSYSPDTVSVPAGKVTFWLVNSGSAAHDLIIRDGNNNLAAGQYTFFCDQPGHEQSGMKGKLTVT